MQEKKILLTNKELFIRPGLWLLCVEKAKVFGFFKQDENRQRINWNTHFSVLFCYISDLNLRFSFHCSLPPLLWLYTTDFPSFPFFTLLHFFFHPLLASSHFSFCSLFFESLDFSLAFLPFSIQVDLSPSFSLSFFLSPSRPGRVVMVMCAAWRYMCFHFAHQRQNVWIQLCPNWDMHNTEKERDIRKEGNYIDYYVLKITTRKEGRNPIIKTVLLLKNDTAGCLCKQLMKTHSFIVSYCKCHLAVMWDSVSCLSKSYQMMYVYVQVSDL